MKTSLIAASILAFSSPAYAGANCYVINNYVQCFGTGANEGSTLFGSTVAGTTRLYGSDQFGNTDTWAIHNNNLLNEMDGLDDLGGYP